MKLNIHPKVALCDQKLDIIVSELPPQALVKIGVSMRFPWANSVLFEATACFTANANGQVDLSKQRPGSGSYDFVDPMGLIVSMNSNDPKAIQKIAQNISVNESLFFNFSVACGQECETAVVERYFKSPEIQCMRILDEFVGEFFYVEDAKRPVILFIGGSGSGLGVDAPVSAALASHGFNVLSVSFFGERGLPAQLSRVPLEYFDKIFAWLSKNPFTSGKEVWILGMSKGAEVSLILAAQHSFITRVALWAPHAYCFQGIAFKNESSWSYQGKDLPYIRLKNRWVFAHMLGCMIKNQPFGYTPVFVKGLKLADNKDAARIKVENANADFLFCTSKDCGMWNTYDGTVEIMATLRASAYQHTCEQIVYEDAGEPYYVPYVIPASLISAKIAPRLTLSMGGTLWGNAHAKVDAWEKTIAFFKRGNGVSFPVADVGVSRSFE